MARHLLSIRNQLPGENISEFLVNLRHMAKDCNFEAVNAQTYQEHMIRDAFIKGLESSTIRQRILENENITLQRAFDLALSLNRAQEHTTAHFLQAGKSASTVKSDAISVDRPDEPNIKYVAASNKITANKKACFFCGGPYHHRSKCLAKDAECFLCSKNGHFARVCRSTKSKNSATLSAPVLSCITASSPNCLQASVVSATVNGVNVQALMDTDSSESYIDRSLYEKLKLNLEGKPSTITMASTTKIAKVQGTVDVELKVFDNTYLKLKVGVMEELCADMILGLDLMKLHDEVNFQLHGPKEVISVDNNSNKSCNVMAAKIEPPRIFRSVPKDCVPVATKSRRYSETDKKFIQEEVSKLLKDEIIEPSQSSWRAQVLITKDERHKKRMVIDYSQTVNRFTHLDAYPLPRIDELINEIAKTKYYSTVDLKSAYYQVPLAKEDREFTAFEANGKLYQYCRMPFGVSNGVSTFQRIIDNLIDKYNLKQTYAYLDNVTVTGIDKNEHDENLKALLDAAKCEGFTFNESKSVYAVTELDLLGYRVSYNTIKLDPSRLQPLINLPFPSTKRELKRCLGLFAYYARWIKDFSTKIAPLNATETFPLSKTAELSFEMLRKGLLNACLQCINDDEPFTVECDASDLAIGATLNQSGRPVAFYVSDTD